MKDGLVQENHALVLLISWVSVRCGEIIKLVGKEPWQRTTRSLMRCFIKDKKPLIHKRYLLLSVLCSSACIVGVDERKCMGVHKLTLTGSTLLHSVVKVCTHTQDGKACSPITQHVNDHITLFCFSFYLHVHTKHTPNTRFQLQWLNIVMKNNSQMTCSQLHLFSLSHHLSKCFYSYTQTHTQPSLCWWRVLFMRCNQEVLPHLIVMGFYISSI